MRTAPLPTTLSILAGVCALAGCSAFDTGEYCERTLRCSGLGTYTDAAYESCVATTDELYDNASEEAREDANEAFSECKDEDSDCEFSLCFATNFVF